MLWQWFRNPFAKRKEQKQKREREQRQEEELQSLGSDASIALNPHDAELLQQLQK